MRGKSQSGMMLVTLWSAVSVAECAKAENMFQPFLDEVAPKIELPTYNKAGEITGSIQVDGIYMFPRDKLLASLLTKNACNKLSNYKNRFEDKPSYMKGGYVLVPKAEMDEFFYLILLTAICVDSIINK